MKKIVITGATGFIGIHLIKEWMKDTSEIYAIVRPRSKNSGRIPHNGSVHIIELQMSEYDQLPALIGSADFFYHLAWEGARAPYRDNKELQENNYRYTLKAFEAARKMGCTFFLGSGSQAEYGHTSGLVNEEYPCNPTTEYGKQKLHAFETLRELSKDTGIRFIWTRIFSIYGPYDYSGTLVMQCLEKMKRNETIEMTAGTQLWDYLYVEDAAKAMKLFAQSKCDNGIYIIASGDYKPLREYVMEMKKLTGSQSELAFGVVPYGEHGPVNLTPDPTKIKNVLGWQPFYSFSDGIKRTIDNSNQRNKP